MPTVTFRTMFLLGYICLVEAPTSEMDTVPLLKQAEANNSFLKGNTETTFMNY
jgi:hypothetical protein